MKNTASPMLRHPVPAKSGRATITNAAASSPRSPRIFSRFLAAAATLATAGIGAVGYFAAAPDALAETTTINVNFTAAGHEITMDGAGAYKVDASAWNNFTSNAGTNVALSDGTGQLLDGITLSWSGASGITTNTDTNKYPTPTTGNGELTKYALDGDAPTYTVNGLWNLLPAETTLATQWEQSLDFYIIVSNNNSQTSRFMLQRVNDVWFHPIVGGTERFANQNPGGNIWSNERIATGKYYANDADLIEGVGGSYLKIDLLKEGLISAEKPNLSYIMKTTGNNCDEDDVPGFQIVYKSYDGAVSTWDSGTASGNWNSTAWRAEGDATTPLQWANGNRVARFASSATVSVDTAVATDGIWVTSGSLALTNDGGSLAINAGGKIRVDAEAAFTSAVSPTGDFRIENNGTVALADSTTISGGINGTGSLSLGGTSSEFTLGASSTLSTLNFNGTDSTLNLNGTATTIARINGTATITRSTAGTGTLTLGDGTDRTFAGTLANGAGTLALVKTGTGTLELTGTNSIGAVASDTSAGVTIAQGTLSIPSVKSISRDGTNTTSPTIYTNSNSGAFLKLTGTDTDNVLSTIKYDANGNTLTVNVEDEAAVLSLNYLNSVGDNSYLYKTGAGTLRYAGSGANNYGNTTVQGGTLLLGKTADAAAVNRLSITGGLVRAETANQKQVYILNLQAPANGATGAIFDLNGNQRISNGDTLTFVGFSGTITNTNPLTGVTAATQGKVTLGGWTKGSEATTLIFDGVQIVNAGNVIVNGGVLHFAKDSTYNRPADFSFNNDAYTLTVAAAAKIGGDGILRAHLNGTADLNIGGYSVPDTSSTYSPLTGTYASTIPASGTLVFALNSPAFTGKINVAANNTLRVGNDGTTGDLGSGTAAVALASGATLEFARSDYFSTSRAITGTGAIVKNGGNTAVLGGNTSATNVTVNSGTLLFQGATNSVTGTYLVKNGANAGINGSIGTLVLGEAAGDSVSLSFSGQNNVVTTLTQNAGTVIIDAIALASLHPGKNGGVVNLFTGSGLSSIDFTTWSLSTVLLGAPAIGYTADSLFLTFSPYIVAPKAWTGGTDDVWEAGGSANWNDGTASPVAFYALDAVNFSDTGENKAIKLIGDLAPATITVNNSAGNDYTFGATGSTGKIATGSLVKKGDGTLTLTTANTYAGGTVIEAGAVTITNAGALGLGSVTLQGGTTLTSTAGFPVNALVLDTDSASSATLNLPNAALSIGNSITGTGNLNLTGNGTRTFTGSNSDFTGKLIFNGTGTGDAITFNGIAADWRGTDIVSNNTTATNIYFDVSGTAKFGSLTFSGGNVTIGSSTNTTTLDIAKITRTASGANSTIARGNNNDNQRLTSSTGTLTFDVGTDRVLELQVKVAGVSELVKTGAGELKFTSTEQSSITTGTIHILEGSIRATGVGNQFQNFTGNIILEKETHFYAAQSDLFGGYGGANGRAIRFTTTLKPGAVWHADGGTQALGVVNITNARLDWSANSTAWTALTAQVNVLGVTAADADETYPVGTVEAPSVSTIAGATNKALGLSYFGASDNTNYTTFNVEETARLEVTAYFGGRMNETDSGTSNAFNKIGAGTMVLFNNKSLFTGTIAVTGGVLELGVVPTATNPSVLGNTSSERPFTLSNGATLRYVGTNDTQGKLNFNISGDGTGIVDIGGNAGTPLVTPNADAYVELNRFTSPLTKVGVGTLALTGTAANTGLLTIGSSTKAGGTVLTGKTDAIGTDGASIVNGTLRLGGDNQINAGATLTLAANGTFDLNGKSNTLVGLNGTAGVVTSSTGTGTLTLNGSALGNTFGGSLQDGDSGTLALVKASAGTQILSGTNTYTGATTINGGTLINAGSLASAVTVNSGGTFATTSDAIGTGALTVKNGAIFANNGGSVGDLTFESGAIFKLSVNTGGTGVAIINAGALVVANSTRLDISGVLSLLSTAGDKTFLTYAGGFTDFSNFTVEGVTGSRGVVTVAQGAPGALILSVSAPAFDLRWNGTSANNQWKLDDGATPWDGTASSASANERFYNADRVTFDAGTSPTHKTVDLVGEVLPASVAVIGDGFVFSGSGAIGGATSLVKKGGGTLTIGNANTYTGGTFIESNGGSITATTAGALGTGAVTLGNGTALNLDATGVTNAIAVLAGDTATLNLANGFTFGGVFSNGTDAQSIPYATGGTVVLGGGNSETRTFSAVAASAFKGTLVAKQGTYAFSGNSADWSSTTFATDGTDAPTFSFTGSGTIKVGAFAALASGAVNITATLDVVSGSITRAAADENTFTFNNGTVTSSSGTLTVDTNGATGATIWKSVLTGTGLKFIKTGAGTLQLAGGAQSYTGGTLVSGGTLELVNGVTLGASSKNFTVGTGTSGPVLRFNYTSTSGDAFSSNGGTITLNGGEWEMYNYTSGDTPRTFTLTGTGTWRVNNSRTGLQKGSIALDSASTIIVENGNGIWHWGDNGNSVNWTQNKATLQIGTGSVVDMRNNAIVGGGLTGAGSILNSGNGNTGSYLGKTVTLGNGTTAEQSFTFAGNINAGTNTGGYGAVLGNAGSTSNPAATHAPIDLIKVGGGTQIFTGTVKSNLITINGGTFQFGDGTTNAIYTPAGSNPAIVINGTDGGNLVFANPEAQTVGAAISGAGSFTKKAAGTLTLNGAVSYNGATAIEGGTLAVASAASLANTSGVSITGTSGVPAALDLSAVSDTVVLKKLSGNAYSNVTLAAGTTLSIGAVGVSTFDGSITSTSGGALEKTGAGTLILGGVSTYTGDTLVKGGSLFVHGSIAGNVVVKSGATLGGGTPADAGEIGGNITVETGGFLSPGASIGTLESTGNVTIAAGATLIIEVNTANNTYDILGIDAAHILTFEDGAILQLVNITPGSPLAMNELKIFGSVATNVQLDGFLDLRVSDFADLTALDFVFNGANGISTTAIPEPSTYALFGAIGAVALALLRRRKKQK